MVQFIPRLFSTRAIMISPSLAWRIFEIALSLSSSRLYHNAYKEVLKASIKEICDDYETFYIRTFYETFYISDRSRNIYCVFPFFAPLMKNKIYTVSYFHLVQSFLLRIPDKSHARSEFEAEKKI